MKIIFRYDLNKCEVNDPHLAIMTYEGGDFLYERLPIYCIEKEDKKIQAVVACDLADGTVFKLNGDWTSNGGYIAKDVNGVSEIAHYFLVDEKKNYLHLMLNDKCTEESAAKDACIDKYYKNRKAKKLFESAHLGEVIECDKIVMSNASA